MSTKPVQKLLVFLGLTLILWFNAWGQESPYEPRITYSLSLDEVTWNAFQVALTVSNHNQPRLVFVMPVWMPGAYVRMDFGKNVRNFKAQGTRGQVLEVIQLDDHRWSVAAGNNSIVRVSYDVEVSPRGFMGRSLDSTRARIDGPATFMYVQGLENFPVTVRLKVPETWKVATGLRSTSYLFEYTAKNYDTLIDSPIEMGDFVDYYFNHQGRNFTITIDGDTTFNIENFLVMIYKIVSYQADLFDDLPFENYLFMFNVYPDYRGGGGLEHHNSTTIGLSGKKLAEDVENAANVIAHEFFHLWNGKRIRPRGLGPFDYTQEARTRALWFCEGVTSYYADLTLVRSGIWTPEEFYQNQARQIEMLQENPDRLETSVEQASLKIWEIGYQGTGISFYNKGQLLGLLLDLTIRKITDNQRNLDDVMRFLNWWFARQDVGFEERDILRSVNAIAQHDFSEFFDKYISGTVELPYREVLAYAGLEVTIVSDWVPYIGTIRIIGEKNRVMVIDESTPVGKSGLKKDDFLISLDGKSVSSNKDIAKIVESKKVGEELVLVAEREGIPLTLRTKVGKNQKVRCEIKPMVNPTEKQLRIRQGWLKGSTGN